MGWLSDIDTHMSAIVYCASIAVVAVVMHFSIFSPSVISVLFAHAIRAHRIRESKRNG